MGAGMTRRQLLQAGAAGGVLALGADPLIQRALAALPRARRGQILDDVLEHVDAARGTLADRTDGACLRRAIRARDSRGHLACKQDGGQCT